MATVYLYNISDGVDVVHKDIGITKASISCQLLPDCTLSTPRLKLSLDNIDISNCNYFYLDTYGRYYYISGDSGIMNDGMFQLIGEVDPLMSFSGQIDGLVCLVARNEFEFNGDIVDDMIVPRVRKQISKAIIGNVGREVNIALTVTGGSDNA